MFVALRVLTIVAVASLGLWLFYHVWLAVRSGVANVHNNQIRRRTRPWYYWTAVFIQAGLAVVCFVVVAQALRG
jgi:hypothetical protein